MKNNITKAICLDIYLSNLSEKDYELVTENIKDLENKKMPLMSWDIFMNSFHKNMVNTVKKLDLKQVLYFAKKYNWSNDIEKCFHENDYEALIVTDAKQNIVWVNKGFTTMTGYSKKYALQKTPRFLQGNNTTIEQKRNIREQLKNNMPFKQVIVNHKKNNESYKCEVKIYPLQNKKTTHYIAFEKQII